MASESDIIQLKARLVDEMKKDCATLCASTESERGKWKEHIISFLPEEERSKFLKEIGDKNKVDENNKKEDDEPSFAAKSLIEDVFVTASERIINSLASSAIVSLAAVVGVTIGMTAVVGIAVVTNRDVCFEVGGVKLKIQGGPNQDQQNPPGSDRSLRN